MKSRSAILSFLTIPTYFLVISINMVLNRVTYRRRLSYNTKSNKVLLTKTPGGKLVYHYATKKTQVSSSSCWFVRPSLCTRILKDG